MGERLKKILDLAEANKATDIHLVEGERLRLRVDGKLSEVTGVELTAEEVRAMILSLLTEETKKQVETKKEVDFSFAHGESRFRTNVYWQRDVLAAALRVIPDKVPSFETLNLPQVFNSFVAIRQGFVLVTGPTGHGKSTTVASILSKISEERNCHIVTIEDPVEYVLESKKALVSQREVGADTKSFATALRSALRQDPDVVFVGEMRDLETIASALTIAETGHLVFSTLHTNSAPQTIDRVVDVFPRGVKEQIRVQLAGVLTAVVSERLLPAVEGGMVPAFEILRATPAVRNVIRENKIHLIDNIITTGVDVGMISLEAYLARLVKQGKVEEETALSFALKPGELQSFLRARGGIG